MDDIISAKLAIRLLDLTSLNKTDNNNAIEKLCEKAKSEYGNVAAVCVFPKFIETAKKALSGSGIKIATVVNFPEGNDSLDKISNDIKEASRLGADEIDVVFPYKKFLNEEIDFCNDFLKMVVLECGKRHTSKVILETGEIKKISLIQKASQMCIDTGINFIKTSTGKTDISATPESANAILETIAKNKNCQTGLKVSGGIKDSYEAKKYIILASAIMGNKWINTKTIRIGASSLIDDLIKTIEGE